MSTLQTFKKEGVTTLKDKLSLRNINEVPKLDKVIIAMGIGSLVTRKGQKDFSEFEQNLLRITGQKPRLIKAKKSVSNFKLRQGDPVMLQCTLRGERAYDFVDRFSKLVLPRVRDFIGLDPKHFDARANMTIGLKNYNIFPELGVDDVTIPMGLQITLVTTTEDDKQSQALLEQLSFVFKQQK